MSWRGGVAGQPIGTVLELWRYPVKSMLGERCDALRFDMRGAEGDRLFAVRDASGKFGSGKNTRRFRKMDGLYRFRSSYRGQVSQVQFPSGEVMSGDSPSIHHALSNTLGHSVELAREAEISHLDAGPVHLVTTASLEWLRSALPGANIDARRFRPNLVVGLPGSGLVEQAWIGQRLRVGNEVELVVDAATERCGMVTFAQEELPEEPGVLGHIAQEASLYFGVYAQVAVPGIVRLNDAVALKS